MKRMASGSEEMVRFGATCSEGDQLLARFEEPALALFDSLYNFASWLVQNESETEHLVQETYQKALRNFASFEPGTNFRSWMFRIRRNILLSSRATLDRRLTVEIDSEDDVPVRPVTSTTPQSQLIELSQQNAVQSSIEKLPIIFREALFLSDLENASYREISEILSIPAATVMSRLAKARRTVRESVLGAAKAPLSKDWPHHAAKRVKGLRN